MKLDVSRFPREAHFVGPSSSVNLASIPLAMRLGIEELARVGRIKTKDSFGCAVARVNNMTFVNWNDPYKFVWFVAGWGPENNKYIANAVRKQRPSLRTGRDTLELRMLDPDAFQDKVESDAGDGSFEWGDFPWGGATFVKVGDLLLLASVSCLLEVEDDAIAKGLGGLVGAEMLKIMRPNEYGPKS